jgi:UDP-N-acetyl-D-mannosaminuronic acid dehydrogenase
MYNVLIIGAGYVGLTLGVVASEAGHRVSLVETDNRKLTAIRAGRSHFYENGIDDRIALLVKTGRLSAHGHLLDAIASFSDSSDVPTVYIITLGTPLSSVSKSSYNAIKLVASEIASICSVKDILILRSTVSIGTTARLAREHKELRHLAFCPERTIEGNALNELTELPQIIGYSSPYAKAIARDFFLSFSPSVIFVSNCETAEAVKLISNTFRDLNFAFANAVALLGLEHKFSSVEAIAAANASYQRSNIPVPGPVGGPCLEKDSLILCDSSVDKNNVEFIRLARKLNRSLVKKVLSGWMDTLRNAFDFERVLICGLAFKGKPLTNDTRGSLAHDVVLYFSQLGLATENLIGLDPLVDSLNGLSVVYRDIDSIPIYKSTLIIICTDHELFDSKLFISFLEKMRAPTLSYWKFPKMSTSMHKLSFSLGEGGYKQWLGEFEQVG